MNRLHAQAAGEHATWVPATFPKYTHPSQVEPSPRHTGLLITGGSTLIASYVVTVIATPLIEEFWDENCDVQQFRGCEAADLQYFPILGPWLATAAFPPEQALFFGLSQGLGVALSVAGLVRFTDVPLDSSEATAGRKEATARLDVAALPLPGGALLTASGRF